VRAREALEEWPEAPHTGELRTLLLDAAACATAASMKWHDIAARFNALTSAAEHAHLVDGSVVGSSHDALDDFSDEIATRPF
jgi:hypothetical protein